MSTTAKFQCLQCDAVVKPGKVVRTDVLAGQTAMLRYHESPGGNFCGPLVWHYADLDTKPSRDVVISALRRAAYGQYGIERGEILVRAVEKGWQ